MSTSAGPGSIDGGPGGHTIDRRTLLAGAGGMAGLGSLGTPIITTPAYAASSSDPVSMAMHIHGSFSEGKASMDAHLDQARRLGVDVIWWTDHDFRASAFGYRQAIGFDGPHEYDGPWDLEWKQPAETGLTNTNHDFITGPTNPDEAGKKLSVEAQARDSGDWSDYLLEADAQNATYSTSYCDTTLTLDIRPQAVSADTQTVIEIVSSYRPARGGRPAGQYRIQYRIGDSAGRRTEGDGLLGVVGIKPGAADQWQRVTISPRADHVALWPDTVADDASLWRLRLGVRARNGATAQVYFDRLRFVRDRKTPADGRALLQGVIDQYQDRYPEITQYAASEVSLVLHLNAFGGDGTLPTYTQKTASKNPTLSAQRAMVDYLHSHGATVSLNHPLQGARGLDDLARRLVSTRGNGADVIEIGTGMVPSGLIRVFDIAARNAVFLTASGTTDDHRGMDWLRGRRWLTAVWSPSRRYPDLCAALEAGRAWFYDPLYWKGALDLRANGTTPMGGVLFTRKGKVDFTVRATALAKGAFVDVVIGRCDLAGIRHLTPVNRVHRLPAAKLIGGRWSTKIERGTGVYVRAVVRHRTGAIVGFSNPLWVLPVAKRGRVTVPPLRR